MRERHDRAQDDRPRALAIVMDERPVDLDRVEGEALQIGERGIAGAEIVERRDRRQTHGCGPAFAPHIPGFPSRGFRSIRASACRARHPARRTAFTSCSRSWRSNCRDETLTLAKIGGSTSRACLPGGKLACRTFERENAEIDDAAGLLRDRDEFGRAQAPEPRMIPAQQGLETGDGAVLEPDDRLETEFASRRDRARGADRASSVRRSERAVRIAGRKTSMRLPPMRFAVAHRDLGIVQHVLAFGVQLRIEKRKADRGGQRNFDFAEGDGCRQSTADRHWRAR